MTRPAALLDDYRLAVQHRRVARAHRPVRKMLNVFKLFPFDVPDLSKGIANDGRLTGNGGPCSRARSLVIGGRIHMNVSVFFLVSLQESSLFSQGRFRCRMRNRVLGCRGRRKIEHRGRSAVAVFFVFIFI